MKYVKDSNKTTGTLSGQAGNNVTTLLINVWQIIMQRYMVQQWTEIIKLSKGVSLLLPNLANFEVNNGFFQQNGATCQSARTSIAALRETIPGRVI